MIKFIVGALVSGIGLMLALPQLANECKGFESAMCSTDPTLMGHLVTFGLGVSVYAALIFFIHLLKVR